MWRVLCDLLSDFVDFNTILPMWLRSDLHNLCSYRRGVKIDRGLKKNICPIHPLVSFRSERYRQQDFTNKKKPAASACTVSLFCQRRPTQAWQQAIFAGQEEQLKELTNTVRKLDPATAWPYQELLLRTSTFISFWQKLSKSILRDWSMDISFLQISSCSSLFSRCCVQNFVLWHWRWWWCP